MSYRREDADFPAGWLYDRLSDHYSGGQVFKDVDSIELGDDFIAKITSAVGSCDVLLALIGDTWPTMPMQPPNALCRPSWHLEEEGSVDRRRSI
jgi:hypothetical protein